MGLEGLKILVYAFLEPSHYHIFQDKSLQFRAVVVVVPFVEVVAALYTIVSPQRASAPAEVVSSRLSNGVWRSQMGSNYNGYTACKALEEDTWREP